MENNKLSYHSNFKIVYLRYKLKKGTLNVSSYLYRNKNLSNNSLYSNKLKIIKNICKPSSYKIKNKNKSERVSSIKTNRNTKSKFFKKKSLNENSYNIFQSNFKNKNVNENYKQLKYKPVYSKYISKIPNSNKNFNNYYNKNFIDKINSSNNTLENFEDILDFNDHNKLKKITHKLKKKSNIPINIIKNNTYISRKLKKKSKSMEILRKINLSLFNSMLKNEVKKIKRKKKKKIKKNKKMYATKWTKIINYLIHLPKISYKNEIGYFSINKIFNKYNNIDINKNKNIKITENIIYKLNQDLIKNKVFN